MTGKGLLRWKLILLALLTAFHCIIIMSFFRWTASIRCRSDIYLQFQFQLPSDPPDSHYYSLPYGLSRCYCTHNDYLLLSPLSLASHCSPSPLLPTPSPPTLLLPSFVITVAHCYHLRLFLTWPPPPPLSVMSPLINRHPLYRAITPSVVTVVSVHCHRSLSASPSPRIPVVTGTHPTSL